MFAPVSSPYDSAIYANGIIESDQSSGSNINIYPEVSGPITKVLVREGQQVSAGAPLFTIDDSVQRATTEQLRLQAEASLALLNELKAEPRPETLAVAEAQVGQAESNLKAARDQYDKDRASYDIDPKSISKDVLDTAEDAVKQADAGLDVARKQYELTKAGAWSYDIANQEKQYEALRQAYEAANALLLKYSVKAPIDGVVLAVNAAVGSYVSSQGAYDPYTQAFDQLVIMGPPQDYLAVRCYRRRDPGLAAAVEVAHHRADVGHRHRHQGAAGVRPGAALCLAQDRAVERAPGEGGPAGAAGDFPVPETGRPGLSGPAGGCLHRAEVASQADPTPPTANAMNAFRSSVAAGRRPRPRPGGARRLRGGPQFRPSRRRPMRTATRTSRSLRPRSRRTARRSNSRPTRPLSADWWRLFKSAPLDAVVRQAIANNPTLQAAEASLRQSQDNLRAGYGVFFPRIDAERGRQPAADRPAAAGPADVRARSSIW